jgi:hypothetical protein
MLEKIGARLGREPVAVRRMVHRSHVIGAIEQRYDKACGPTYA